MTASPDSDALQREEERYRLATAAAGVAVWEYDFLAGQMTRSGNHDALYGLPHQEIWTYDVFIKATHPDDRERSDRIIAACAAPGGSDEYAFDFRVIWPDASIHWLACSGRVVSRDPSGNALVVRGALVDVTRYKRVEDELRDAVRARNEFLQIAAHELRTPLTPLALKLSMALNELRAGGGQSPSQRLGAHLEGAQRQVSRLSQLVDGLLDVGRLSSAAMSLELGEVDLASLVRAVAEDMSAQAERARCRMTVEAAATVRGHWDRGRLEQVIRNLLSNALKYGAGRPVDVRADARDGRARISVRDEGIGIAPEDQARIFRKFERAVSDKRYAGLGLGLFIAREIVEAHGGELTVTSSPGAGSTFVVELPLRRDGAVRDR